MNHWQELAIDLVKLSDKYKEGTWRSTAIWGFLMGMAEQATFRAAQQRAKINARTAAIKET